MYQSWLLNGRSIRQEEVLEKKTLKKAKNLDFKCLQNNRIMGLKQKLNKKQV